MAEPSLEFQRTQQAFAAYIRDPARHPLPAGIAPVRMAAYRELFLNNIESFVATGFPVLRSILAEAQWQALVEDFYARHRCRTPLFVEIAEEFLDYLAQERGAPPEDPAFLLELAHYEWVELALAVGQAEPPPVEAGFALDPLAHTVRLSELAWALCYRFPVHRLGPDFQPATPPADPSYLVAYRDREDTVRFLEINPATYRLLHILDEAGPQPAAACLERLARELGHPDPAAVLAFGADILKGLAERGVIGAARA
jgi:hypothetical protein